MVDSIRATNKHEKPPPPAHRVRSKTQQELVPKRYVVVKDLTRGQKMRVCGLDPSPFLSRHSDVTSRWDVFLITTDNSFADLQRGGNSCPSARRRISHFPLPECKGADGARWRRAIRQRETNGELSALWHESCSLQKRN